MDVFVLGAGPGGYPAAIRAAQLRNSVIIVDKGYIGGECLNFGCIPSKALITASKFYYKLQNEVSKFGIKGGKNTTIDMAKLQKWKESIQRRLINGIKRLFKQNNVELILGTARFISKNQAEIILNEGGKEIISFKKAIIATGAEFVSIPKIKIDEVDILSVKGTLGLIKIPSDFLVIGGGVIGLELSIAFAKLGSKVTVIELLPELMTGVDRKLVKVVKKQLRKLDISVITEAKITSVDRDKGKLFAIVETSTGVRKFDVEKILMAVGKKASSDHIGLDKLGVNTNASGFIQIDDNMMTNIQDIYAVGDCTGMPFLAHKATKQGIFAAEVISGHKSKINLNVVPSVIFTDPEIAYVGMSEEDAEKSGYSVNVEEVPYGISGRALSMLESDGFIQVISDKQNNLILGVQMVGSFASELIGEATLAISMGLTVNELGSSIHPHPTLSELLMEAAEANLGKAIHIDKKIL